MHKFKTITVKGIGITTLKINGEDFISLTDIARNKNPDEPKDVVKNWLRSKTTIEFIGLWEQLNNPSFKGVEFDSFLYAAGSNAFTLSPSKWIEATNAIGLISKQGNSGGTFAHKDIAFEFASTNRKTYSNEQNRYSTNEIIGEQQTNKENEIIGHQPVWRPGNCYNLC